MTLKRNRKQVRNGNFFYSNMKSKRRRNKNHCFPLSLTNWMQYIRLNMKFLVLDELKRAIKIYSEKPNAKRSTHIAMQIRKRTASQIKWFTKNAIQRKRNRKEVEQSFSEKKGKQTTHMSRSCYFPVFF